MPTWRFWLALAGAGLFCSALAPSAALHAIGLEALNRTEGPAWLRPTSPVLPIEGLSLTEGQPAFASPIPPPRGPAAGSVAGAARSLFEDSQIVSYYGHPQAASMGVLGDGPRAEMVERLKLQAAAYQALAPDRAVIPALHLVYEVAQASTNDDGLYLYRLEDETVRQFIQLTRDEHMLLFLDLQIGRSTLKNELAYVLPYLREPHVHLAIDPEFITPKGYHPGQYIGTLDCLDVNAVEDTLAQMAAEQHLPNKIVIVHQFNEDMLKSKEKLRFNVPRVDTVLDMDGYGDQSGKLDGYQRLVKQFGAKYAGIKLFYKQDRQLLSEAQVESLDPRPNLIIYQ